MDIEENDIYFQFNKFKGYWDIEFTEDGTDLLAAANLVNAVGICIFTDRRSNSDDIVPNQKGYAGDALNGENELPLGSKLWMLLRGKSLPSVLIDAEKFVTESLQWLLDDGIAKELNPVASYENGNKELLRVDLEIVRLTGEKLKFSYVWEQNLLFNVTNG